MLFRSGPNQTKFKDMKEAIFGIERFSKFKGKFEFHGDGKKTITLLDKLDEVWKHLSYYVHTSNIHIELKGKRPHITHDLGENPKAEYETKANIAETFDLILIMLILACGDKLEETEKETIKKIISNEFYKVIFE